MLWDTYTHYIEKINQEEDLEVRRTYDKEYLKLRFLTGLFWDLSTSWGRLLYFLHFVYTTSNFLFTAYILAISTIKAAYWRLDVGLVTLAFLAATIYAYTIYLTVFLSKDYFALIHKDIGRNFFRYSLEIDTNEEFIRWIALKLKQYMHFVNPSLMILATAVYVLIRLPVEERYVNGLDFTLPIPAYYPFKVCTWLDYLIVSLSQVLGSIQTLILTFYGLTVHSNVVMKIATQLQRLKDSIQQIEKRAFYLVEMMHENVELTDKYKKKEFELYIDDEFVSCVKICLKENFEHYKIIQKTYKTWTGHANVSFLLAIVLYAVVSGSSAAILSMDGSYIILKFTCLVFFANVTFCGFAVCGAGQVVTNLSEDIFRSFYNLKWYTADRRVTTNLRIISLGVMKPIRPLVLGLIPIDFEAFCLMLRTAYSFQNFFMLRSFSEAS